MRKALILLAGIGGFGLLGSISAIASTAPAAPPSLPEGAGRETVVRVCSSCHAAEIVAQQRLTAEGWKEVVEIMANNGAVGTDAEFAEITAYLAKAFPAEGDPPAGTGGK